MTMRWIVAAGIVSMVCAACATPPQPTRVYGQSVSTNLPVFRPPSQARPAPRAPTPAASSAQPRPAPAPAPARPAHSFGQVLKLQVALDRELMSPGCLDGRWGSQVEEALIAWKRRHGQPANKAWDESVSNLVATVTNEYTTYTITDADLQGLAPVPTTWRGKAAAPALGYETVLEALSERAHAKQALLRDLNPEAAWPSPAAGTAVRLPNVAEGARRPSRIARLEVHLGRKFIDGFDDAGRLTAHYPCSIAQKVDKRPRGSTKIVSVAPNPNYTFDPALFEGDPEAATIGGKMIIPPGPNNPVGVAWIGLELTGYGMHGTPRPEDIGRTESHGCFRLHNWNADRLCRSVAIGLPVIILADP